jgi:hypothetical protein
VERRSAWSKRYSSHPYHCWSYHWTFSKPSCIGKTSGDMSLIIWLLMNLLFDSLTGWWLLLEMDSLTSKYNQWV